MDLPPPPGPCLSAAHRINFSSVRSQGRSVHIRTLHRRLDQTTNHKFCFRQAENKTLHASEPISGPPHFESPPFPPIKNRPRSQISLPPFPQIIWPSTINLREIILLLPNLPTHNTKSRRSLHLLFFSTTTFSSSSSTTNSIHSFKTPDRLSFL